MIRAATLALTLALPATDASTLEADRAFLAGADPGSLAAPARLTALAEVEALCRTLEVPHTADEDAEPTPEVRATRRKVYAVRVPPKGFRLEPGEGVRIDLAAGLFTFGGDLGLTVLARDSGRFALGPSAAEGVVEAVRAGKVALDVVFRLEGADSGLSPCAGHPRSRARNLRIEPLSFALVDPAKDAELARVRTAARAELTTWLTPGAAAPRVEVRASAGLVDTEVVAGALKSAEAVQACLRPVLDSPAGTGLASFGAKLTPAGRFEQVVAEVESFDDDGVVSCLVAAIAGAEGPRTKRGAQLSVLVAVDRGGPD